MLQATCIAAVYDFFVTTFHVWKEYLNFQFVPLMKSLADRDRMVFNFDAIGFILGLGYVMGLRIAMIFCAGGVLANFVLVPAIWFIGSHMGDVAVYPANDSHLAHDGGRDLSLSMCASSAWAPSRRPDLSASSNRCAWSRARSASHCMPFVMAKLQHTERTDRDIPIIAILLGVVVSALAVAIFFGQLHVTWTRACDGPGC